MAGGYRQILGPSKLDSAPVTTTAGFRSFLGIGLLRYSAAPSATTAGHRTFLGIGPLRFSAAGGAGGGGGGRRSPQIDALSQDDRDILEISAILSRCQH